MRAGEWLAADADDSDYQEDGEANLSDYQAGDEASQSDYHQANDQANKSDYQANEQDKQDNRGLLLSTTVIVSQQLWHLRRDRYYALSE